MSIIRKLSNLILYSSLWIATCAAALVTFTYDVTGSDIGMDAYVGVVFCGTLVLYSLHRLVGMQRVQAYEEQGRFKEIRPYRGVILTCCGLGIIAGAYFLINLTWEIIFLLIIPVAISLLYVVPIGKRKRLRDFSFVKIFLVSAMWATLTGLIPYIHTGTSTWSHGSLLFLERALFIFAIAIPFDIRDVRFDLTSGVKTLPQSLGIPGAKNLALGLLFLSAMCMTLLIRLEVYDYHLMFPFLICSAITAALIWYSQPGFDEYYYGGLVDGTLFMIAFGYWIATCI